MIVKPASNQPVTIQALNRRDFLRGSMKVEKPISYIRPPWTSESSILENCISCGDCISACPEKILFADKSGKPAVSFDAGYCTFCSACAESCQEVVFDLERETPWVVTVEIKQSCLLHTGVTCQLCTDICETEALNFDFRARPSGAMHIDADSCTGCGACIATCPVSAIVINDQRLETSV